MLNIEDCDLNNVEILEGSTTAYVMLIDNKIIYRKDTPEIIQKLVNFYQMYDNTEFFPKLIRFENDFSSIHYKYIPGSYHIKKVNAATYDYIQSIVDSYIKVVDSGISWQAFIKKRKDTCLEIYHLQNLDLFRGVVEQAYKYIKNDITDLYLIHGDLGSHNFIANDDKINGVIDPEPLLANKLYDYYFAITSSKELLANFDIAKIENKTHEAYFIFNLFASLSKVLFHHPEDKYFYLDYFFEYTPKYFGENNET